MSKEMLVIVLGVLVLLSRTMLGIPGTWQTPLLVVAGGALVVLGFLLRGEALSRAQAPRPAHRAAAYAFVETHSTDSGQAAAEAPLHHGHQEGTTSLN